MSNPLIIQSERGLYCEAGDFYIDPWQPVERAVVTHPHSDHAHWGSAAYLVSREGERVFRSRLGAEANLQTVAFGERVNINGVTVSLHPAGHILGSAQIRVEHRGEVWVASGDYKLRADPTCAAFEPVRCHAFITEATFGLPIYRWPEPADVFAGVNAWWRANQARGRASLIFAYAAGKSQRILASVDSSIGPIFTHGAKEVNQIELRSEAVVLAPERALHWPRAATLLVADVHLSKDTAFRAAGLLVPSQVTGNNLARLTVLLERTAARRVIFLGDLVHSRSGLDAQTIEIVAAWREQHARIEMVLISGNHDTRSGKLPPAWRLDLAGDELIEPPFVFRHHPEASPPRSFAAPKLRRPEASPHGYTLAGHIHPSVVLTGRGRQRERLACFLFREEYGVLPAFGTFTGTRAVAPQRADRIFAIADDEVIELSAHSTR